MADVDRLIAGMAKMRAEMEALFEKMISQEQMLAKKR
jgi:hypothetical protein